MAAQLALYDPRIAPAPTDESAPATRRAEGQPPLCAACRAREARYGFQTEADDPQVERPRTLCFECFRLEIGRRHDQARAVQARLPLDQALEGITRRRRRAQIAARRALGL
ncbi:MAG: hypothetical protein A3J29_22995 [Acidobacteria bacterium RIFCSPLOWO2_12_FULL_67_14b]|nr:MAG: hypothetical protein A3I61_13605 [Acidobacteria bacterium RIFCSPLOWO2_02_FULL_68_18]OFW45378.1 MAG: hypothetical protein A3J29_22995 [Acidobacteria bacterium RIFCSPLOWO2_12_FULL_67_14b]